MAVIKNNRYPDLVNAYLKDGLEQSHADLIDSLAVRYPLLQDAVIQKCNSGLTHRMNILSGLPEAFFTKYYEGHQPSAATRVAITEDTALLKSTSSVDLDLLDAVCNTQAEKTAFCEAESMYNREAMSKTITENIFYGDKKANDSQFTGFSARFNQLSGSSSSSQIINAGGAGGATTSIWLITWGDRQSSIIYPGSTMAGIEQIDRDNQKVYAENGKSFMARETEFTWQAGLAVSDWRYVVRIVNVPVAGLRDNSFDVYRYLSDAWYQHEGRYNEKANTCIYGNSEVLRTMDNQAVNRGAGDNFVRLMSGDDVQGKAIKTYRGMPVKECEMLSSKEIAIN